MKRHLRLTIALLVGIGLLMPLALAEDEGEEEAPEEEAQEEPEPQPQEGPVDIQQVQIQVWISETTEDGLRDLGTNLNYTRFVRGEEMSGSLERIQTQTFDPMDPDQRVTLPAPGNREPLRPDLEGGLGDGVQTQRGAGLTFSIIDAGRGTIDGVFRSLERKTDVDLISKPELLVTNQNNAIIHAGGEVPYQGLEWHRNEPVLNVRWQNIGVDLDLTPIVLPNNMVQLNINTLDVSDVVRIENVRGVDLPVFSTRSQTGEVVVPNGQTLVIGGLSSRMVRSTERRVPVVGRIPLLGIPFRGRQAEAANTHLLIFVSPTIVNLRDMAPEAVNALNFWRQERWRHEGRIDQEIQHMQQGMY